MVEAVDFLLRAVALNGHLSVIDILDLSAMPILLTLRYGLEPHKNLIYPEDTFILSLLILSGMAFTGDFMGLGDSADLFLCVEIILLLGILFKLRQYKMFTVVIESSRGVTGWIVIVVFEAYRSLLSLNCN